MPANAEALEGQNEVYHSLNTALKRLHPLWHRELLCLTMTIITSADFHSLELVELTALFFRLIDGMRDPRALLDVQHAICHVTHLLRKK